MAIEVVLSLEVEKYVERVAALLGKVSLLMHLMSEFSSKHHIKDRFDGITRRRRRGRVLNTKLLDLLLPLVWIASLLPQLQQQQQQQRQYRGICEVRSTAKDSYQRMGDMKVPGPTVMYLETI
ncbi:hypothetical protein HZH66_002000 [Vespula vulgaris]|uniref:Uncharacterized protein n=1 Tax=Vespula vulgaris TaxID=7454 RepID=A0A834NHC1_VESVU|nr:hypothetical protein HZH66_002000 [Vespula vulgaris]